MTYVGSNPPEYPFPVPLGLPREQQISCHSKQVDSLNNVAIQDRTYRHPRYFTRILVTDVVDKRRITGVAGKVVCMVH